MGFQDSSGNICMSSLVILGPSCIGFWDIVWKNRHTDKRRWKPYPRDCCRRC